MTECRTPELQDLLPDYVAGSLRDADRVRVVAHLARCVSCTADLELLQQVRAARPLVAPVDVARIVSALPTPPAPAARPSLQLHANSASGSTERRTSTPPSAARRRLLQGPSLWRMAAAVGVVITGGMSVLIARHGLVGANATAPAVAVRSDSMPVAGLPPVSAASEPTTTRAETTVAITSTGASGRASVAHADVPISYGGLDDVTDDELQRLLDRLEKWDGATSSEPLPSVSPVLVTTRGGALP